MEIMQRLWLGTIAGLLLCAGCGGGSSGTTSPVPANTPSATAVGVWRATSFRGARGTLPYQLFVPTAAKNRKVPLVVFFHGAPEAGTDNLSQLRLAQSRAFVSSQNQARFPCFFVAPQAPEGIPGGDGTWSGLNWRDVTSTQRETPTAPMQLSLDLVRALKAQFPAIDSERVYIVGFSMGAFAVWDAITREPDTFAAAIPVCGGGDPRTVTRIASLPVWAWHDTNDSVIKVARSREMIAAMQLAGGAPRFSQTTGFGHASWIPAFQNPELLPWLFAQKRSSSNAKLSQTGKLAAHGSFRR